MCGVCASVYVCVRTKLIFSVLRRNRIERFDKHQDINGVRNSV